MPDLATADAAISYEQLVAGCDRVRFRTACATLMDDELARELGEALVRSPIPSQQRLALLMRLFRDLPVYTVLCSAIELLHLLGPQGRAGFFAALAASLAKERSAAADAVETALFANLFADAALVEEVWAELTAPGQPDPVIRSVLRVSAQVPWRLKRQLCSRLLGDPAWHPQIFSVLTSARHALFGSTLDPEEAVMLLDRLELPGREAEVEDLRRAIR